MTTSSYVVLYMKGSKPFFSSVAMKEATDLEKAKKFTEAIYISQRDYNNTGNIKGVFGLTPGSPKDGPIKDLVKVEEDGLIYYDGLPTYAEWLSGKGFTYSFAGGKKLVQKKTSQAKKTVAKKITSAKKVVKKTK